MILRGTLKHVEALARIGAETFVDAHRDSAPLTEIDMYVSKTYNLISITNELLISENLYHIIKHDNDIAGFSKMQFDRAHPAVMTQGYSKLDQIYLLGLYRGQHLGAKLLQFNIDLSKASNQAGMWLVVWKGNHEAISFYEKFGFEVVGGGDFQLTENHKSRYNVMALKYDD